MIMSIYSIMAIIMVIEINNVYSIDIDIDSDPLDDTVDAAWDFIDELPVPPRSENCPRCNSVPECYAECDKENMREFDGITTWSQCKTRCLQQGDGFVFEDDLLHDIDTLDSILDSILVDPNDQGCAMHLPKKQKCICVRNANSACKNIGRGFKNCPNCGNNEVDDVTLGVLDINAPQCLATCDWDQQLEINRDIASWDLCQQACKRAGGNFAYKFRAYYENNDCKYKT